MIFYRNASAHSRTNVGAGDNQETASQPWIVIQTNLLHTLHNISFGTKCLIYTVQVVITK